MSDINKQGKYWCFTANNPLDEPEDFAAKFVSSPDFQYLCFQAEFVTQYHYQGYVEFKKIKRGTTVKTIDGSLHLERRKGSQSEAIGYCTEAVYKGEDKHRVAGPWHYGTPSETHQGQRNDIHAGVQLVSTGGIRALVEEDPVLYVKYSTGFNRLSAHCDYPKPVPFVRLLFGPTGVGKTRRSHEDYPDSLWTLPAGEGFWFDGYAGQPHALLDELEGKYTGWKLNQMLKVLDRHKIQVPNKGGFTWWLPETIDVTCNIHPTDWYDWTGRQSKYPALVRRFSVVLWWKSTDPFDVVTLARPDGHDGLLDLTDNDAAWEHFWAGPGGAQHRLDMESGLLISRAPTDSYNF